jgi:hypothetical protein
VVIIPFGTGADHWAKDGIGTTTTAKKAGLIAGDTSVQGDVEGWPEEVHERFWHTMVGIGVEGIGEVSRGRDDCRCIGCNEF